MAKKTKNLTAKDWNTRIRRAKEVKEEWRKRFRVPLSYEYWEGAQRPPEVLENEWITINMIYSNLRAELPSLYQADPFFYVKLKKARTVNPNEIAEMETKAKVRQGFLNYLKSELRLKTKARLSIFDAEIQYGVIKVHYHADMVKNPDAGNPIKIEIDGQEVEVPEVLEPDQIPTNEAYKITRIHPDDYLVDEDAGPIDPDDVCWKAHRIKMPLDDVKGNKNYEAKARNQIKATELSDEAQKEREKRKKGGLVTSSTDEIEPDTVIIWELYDLKNNQWLTLAEGCDDFLKKPGPLPPGIENDPFVDLRFVCRDDSWYPIPPVSQQLDSQREYCEARSKRLVHRKRFNRKYILWEAAFNNPEDAAAKLVSGEDGTVIISSQPVNMAIEPIKDAPLDQQEALEYGYLRQDFQDLAVGPNQRGSTAGVDSATEAGILEKRAIIQEGDKLGLVMDFLTNVGRKLDQLVQAHITEDQAVKIAGPAGDIWQAIKSADYGAIAGEYEYTINVGAETPQLPEIERAQLNAVLQLFANAPQLLLSRSLAKKILELHHIYDDQTLDELQEVARGMMQMMAAKEGAPGQMGSLPGVSTQNPATTGAGAAAGINNVRGGMQ